MRQRTQKQSTIFCSTTQMIFVSCSQICKYIIDHQLLPLGTMLIHKQTPKQMYNQSKSSSKKTGIGQIELQVNISIGKNKYLLQVDKCSNLHEEVLKFLKQYNINLKYQAPILAMVREQLTKKQGKKQEQHNKSLQQLAHIKQQMNNKKKKMNQQQHCQKGIKQQAKMKNDAMGGIFKRQNKQNYPSQYNSNSDNGASTQTPGQSYAESKVRVMPAETATEEETRCQDVYEKWKQKQKAKQQQKMKSKNSASTNANTKQNSEKTSQANKSKTKQKCMQKQEKTQQKQKQKSKSHKKLQSHSPDYFYNKGQKFKQAKQAHAVQLFKERYPFQLNKEMSLTPTKKVMLHQRLFKQHRVREQDKIQKLVSEKNVERMEKTPKVNDKYKQKVIERDSKLNQALGYLIEHKMIDNPYKIQYIPKSPFRKTHF